MNNQKELKLVETVNEVLGDLINGDVIKNIIAKQLESTISDIVRDSMRSYSDFGKTISEKINNVINLAASNVELPEYTKFVSDVVLQQFDKVLQEQAKEQLTELIQKDLGELPSGVLTAEALIKKIQSCFESDEGQEERTIEVSLENSSHSAIYLKITDEENSEETKITLYNHGRKEHPTIGYLESGGWRSRNTRISERSLNTHCMDSLEKFLFRLYCAQTQIDLSEQHHLEDFSVGGHDY